MVYKATMNEELWWIDTGFACGGIVLQNDLVVNTAPIFRKWFFGKDRVDVIKILKNKRWKYVVVYEKEHDINLFYERVFE
jgi:hypothetical protein